MILKLKLKKKWQISQGEQPHKRASVFYDKRTKRLKTREKQRIMWQKEFA